jgi:peroxiredoxin
MNRPGRLFSLLLQALAVLLLVANPAPAEVVRLAPDFTIPGPGNKAKSLKSLRGQPVVLLIAETPRTRAFRKQLKQLREIYSQFASRQVVFVAAFKDGSVEPVQSNVPFSVAYNGPAVAGAYGVADDFALVVIGKDGNVDYQTEKPAAAQRIRDVIQNSFAVQAQARKPTVR